MSNLVSVIIPCFNDGQFLLEAVQSVQHYPDPRAYEIVVVNDGSCDPLTMQVLADVERENCRVIHQPNRGLGAARNAGIRSASGIYILPLDSDNRIRPEYISEGTRVLEQNPRIGVAYGDAEYFGDKTGRWKVPKFSLGRLIQENYIDACAVFRRSAWEEVGGYDEQMPIMGWEDWDFWLRLALGNWGFCHLDAVLFDYRSRGKSMIFETVKHVGELCDYIFGKEQLKDALALRERQQKIARLMTLEQSLEYRLGRAVLNPLRRFNWLLKRIAVRARDATVASK